MAATDVGKHDLPPVDDVDDSLFDYDVGDVFRDANISMDVPAAQKYAARTDRNEKGVGLGIDEEIKVTRKRVPVPKLDESRLLSPAGVPKLRGIVKARLKFKGKGHEYSDMARLLNVYQLWLDDLYPRAKFADGLAIIEKLGHTKRMQTMRREWIDAEKPRESLNSLGEGIEKVVGQENLAEDRTWEVKLGERPRAPIAHVGIDDDLYMATPKSSRKGEKTTSDGDTEKIIPEQSTSIHSISGQKNDGPAMVLDFDDEEEALLALDNLL